MVQDGEDLTWIKDEKIRLNFSRWTDRAAAPLKQMWDIFYTITYFQF